MKEQKERLIERFNHMQKLIPDTIQALSDLPDDGYIFTILDPGELWVTLDYNIANYRKYRREMGSNWLFLNRRFNELMGDYEMRFTHATLDVRLMIDLEMSEDGDVCKIVVDHYRKPEPVYRVECK